MPVGGAYTITVTASDAVGSGSDSMTIDIYDDPCSAARLGVGLGAENLGDITGDPGDPDPDAPDCDTDLYDLTEIVLTWLDETTVLTEPLEKP